jgi:hypothetical protein
MTTAATKATVAPTPRSAATTKAPPKDGGPSRKKATRRATKPATLKRSKSDTIIGLLRRRNGVTTATIMQAVGWQAHSVRAFLSLAKTERGLKIRSVKNAKGQRVYRLKK